MPIKTSEPKSKIATFFESETTLMMRTSKMIEPENAIVTSARIETQEMI